MGVNGGVGRWWRDGGGRGGGGPVKIMVVEGEGRGVG